MLILLRQLPGTIAVKTPGLFYSIIRPVPMSYGTWLLWTVVLEKTLESLLGCKEIQPVHPKGNQSWIFIGRTDVEAKTPIFWPCDVKNWLIWKDPDARKDWREKGTTEDEMVGWYIWRNGQEFESGLRVGDGQGSLAFCSPWGHSRTWPRNWTEVNKLWKRFLLKFCVAMMIPDSTWT